MAQSGWSGGLRVRLGHVLVQRRVITPDDLAEVMTLASMHPRERIGDLLVEYGYATRWDVEEAAKVIERRHLGVPPLGEVLLDAGLIEPVELERALEIQRNQGGQLGPILLSMDVLSSSALAEALSRQNRAWHAVRNAGFDIPEWPLVDATRPD